MESQVSGSGNVRLEGAIAGRAEINVSGSGKIIASGTAREMKTTISGSGEVRAANLEVENVKYVFLVRVM